MPVSVRLLYPFLFPSIRLHKVQNQYVDVGWLRPDADNSKIPGVLGFVSENPAYIHPILSPQDLPLVSRQPYLYYFQSGKSPHGTTSPAFHAGSYHNNS